MKKIVLRKNKEGVMTTQQPQLMVKRFAKDVKVVKQDLRDELRLTYDAEKETRSLKKKLSPELLYILQQELQAFNGFMQREMAEDDTVLDICYTWIAEEQGLLKKGFIKRTEK